MADVLLNRPRLSRSSSELRGRDTAEPFLQARRRSAQSFHDARKRFVGNSELKASIEPRATRTHATIALIGLRFAFDDINA
jgi:hypothetical protein